MIFLLSLSIGLIPARVRSEWDRLKGKSLASIWAPACQDSSHVGNAGVGVVSSSGAPLTLPTFATAQFQRFFDYGRAIRCMLTRGAGRFMQIVEKYGYQGADTDAEQLALTEQLFDAALGELGVVARGQPPVQRTPLWPASWLPALNKSSGSKSAEVQRGWENYDDWLQFMAKFDALSLDASLDAGDVSRAWLVWSSAAETALADA